MQYVSVLDKSGYIYEQITKMSFWQIRRDFELTNVIHKKEDLIQYLNDRRPDVLIMVITPEDFLLEDFSKLAAMFSGTRIILIGNDRSYETVRQYFLNGAFDYLIQPLNLKLLEETLIRIDTLYGSGYLVNALRMQMDALIDNIFLGGGQEGIIIRGIIDKIYEDWKKDSISCQMIAYKAKQQAYEILIDRKPWLEKFLYRNDFTYKPGFVILSPDEIVADWTKAFSEAGRMVLKYQMIDNSLVYRIGKYVVVHVDEKLTLESVSDGVFLSPSYVSHIFKKTTNMSFVDYMAEVKMDRAKVLLRDSQIKIYDVAATVGYSNPEYFARIFKKKTGYAPAEYQRMLEQQNGTDK